MVRDGAGFDGWRGSEAADAAQEARDLWRISYDNTPLLAMPQKQSLLLRELPKGTLVARLDATGPAGWVSVETEDGLEGWVVAIALSRAPEYAGSFRSGQPVDGAVRVGADYAILWPAPEESPPAIDTLEKGTPVVEDGRSGPPGWVFVTTTDGRQGWLRPELLTARGRAAPPPVTSAAQGATRACPYCAEQIQVAAIKCRFCGETLRSPGSAAGAGAYLGDAAQTWRPSLPAPPTPSAWPAAGRTESGMAGRWLILGGGIAMFLSLFFTWVTVLGESYSFFSASDEFNESSGLAELIIIAASTILCGLLRVAGGISRKTAGIWAGIGGALGLVEVVYRASRFNDIGARADLGFGIWVLALASLAVIVGVFMDVNTAS